MVISQGGPASTDPGPPSSSEVLSTQLLQSSVTDREAEHERRRKNGNVPPREGKAVGKNLDQTCLRLAIERPGTTSGGRATTHHFCIACDKNSPKGGDTGASGDSTFVISAPVLPKEMKRDTTQTIELTLKPGKNYKHNVKLTAEAPDGSNRLVRNHPVFKVLYERPETGELTCLRLPRRDRAIRVWFVSSNPPDWSGYAAPPGWRRSRSAVQPGKRR